MVKVVYVNVCQKKFSLFFFELYEKLFLNMFKVSQSKRAIEGRRWRIHAREKRRLNTVIAKYIEEKHNDLHTKCVNFYDSVVGKYSQVQDLSKTYEFRNLLAAETQVSEQQDQPQTEMTVRGQQQDQPQTEMTVSGQQQDQSQTEMTVSGQQQDQPQTEMTVSGQQQDQPQTEMTVSGQQQDQPQTEMTVSGQQQDQPQTEMTVSGQQQDQSQTEMTVSGQQQDQPQTEMAVSEYQQDQPQAETIVSEPQNEIAVTPGYTYVEPGLIINEYIINNNNEDTLSEAVNTTEFDEGIDRFADMETIVNNIIHDLESVEPAIFDDINDEGIGLNLEEEFGNMLNDYNIDNLW